MVKIVIDQGHGGGIAHNRGGVLFNEGDQNFKFGKLLRDELLKFENVEVLLTRNSINENPTLSTRARMGIGADLFISTHSNAASSEVRGIEIFKSKYNGSNTLLVKLVDMGSATLNTPNRGVRYRDYKGGDYWGVFNWGNTAKIKMLIEWVFHTNKDDSRIYLEKQEELAIKTAKIIADHYKLNRKNYGPASDINNDTSNYYVLEAGLFTDKENAEEFLNSISKKGITGFRLEEKKMIIDSKHPVHGFVGTYKCTASRMNVRKEPTTKSAIIAKLYKGHTRDVAVIKNGWAKLKYQDGWASLKYLEKIN